MMKVVTFCTRLCKHYLQVICHTNLGYLASMFTYNGYTCSGMKSSRGLLLYLLNIIASQLNPLREDLVFLLITYSTESHTTAHLFFFSTTGTLGMIAHLSTREPTVSLSHTSSNMEYLYVLSDEGKNNIFKKLDCFYLHINVQYINRVQLNYHYLQIFAIFILNSLYIICLVIKKTPSNILCNNFCIFLILGRLNIHEPHGIFY